MIEERANPENTDIIAVVAKCQSVLNIIINEPTNNTVDATIVTKLWLKDCVIKSTSFVTRDKVSP